MPVSDQSSNRDRYLLIPRVLIFVRRGASVLLIKGAKSKRLWANKYNGIGGHVEPGEDTLSAARRELWEETRLKADMRLCGTVIVDTGEARGIGLYIFSAEFSLGEVTASQEGTMEWVPMASVTNLPIVEDLPELLDRIQKMEPNDPPFHARSYYLDGKLVVVFAEE